MIGERQSRKRAGRDKTVGQYQVMINDSIFMINDDYGPGMRKGTRIFVTIGNARYRPGPAEEIQPNGFMDSHRRSAFVPHLRESLSPYTTVLHQNRKDWTSVEQH